MLINTFELLIGNTPLVRLERMFPEANVYGKLEGRNIGGSVKDRISFYMLEMAFKRGDISPGGLVIEPTSGNTGIGLAIAARRLGFELILTMPESMSVERRALLAAYGAKLELTPASAGMNGAIARARELLQQHPGAYMPMQFDNPDNPKIHEMTTAPELLRDLPGIDYIISGIGTGGTITGVGRYMKEHSPLTRMIAVEPAESQVLAGQPAGPHGIQGIGAGFIPSIYDASLVHSVASVSTERAREYTKLLAQKEALLCGISSGAAIAACSQLLSTGDISGNIILILPDGGEKYISMDVF